MPSFPSLARLTRAALSPVNPEGEVRQFLSSLQCCVCFRRAGEGWPGTEGTRVPRTKDWISSEPTGPQRDGRAGR